MKKIFIGLVLAIFPFTSWAYKADDLNLLAGVGFAGTRGAVGLSFDRLLTENHAMGMGLGVDVVGLVSSVGYRYFFDQGEDSANYYFFAGQRYYYVGANYQFASGMLLRTNDNAIEREYRVRDRQFGQAILGVRDVFKNNIVLDFELSYRAKFAGGAVTQLSGPDKEEPLITKWNDTMGINVALGYVF